jgi:protein TonB
VGGKIVAPKLIKEVRPVYPDLALMARVSAIVIMEARVDIHGNVKQVTVLRGHQLFDDAAVAAVKQWRYKPLLLNGVPTEFILTVTVAFRVTSPSAASVPPR